MGLSLFGRRTSVKTAEKKARPAPAGLAWRSSTVFIVGSISVAIFTDIFLYGIIVPVMPFTLTQRTGIKAEDVQRWNAILFSCYGIALFVGSPIAGLYADLTSSRRLPLLVGLVALAGATVILCVGRGISLLITGRLLQGASAAVVWSVGLALMVDTMGRRIGLAMGYVSIAMSSGLLLSPLVGGAVYAGAGYYAVYYVAFGLLVLDIVLRLLLIEKKVAQQWIDTPATTSASDEEAVTASTAQAPAVAAGPEAVLQKQPHVHVDPATPLPPPSAPVGPEATSTSHITSHNTSHNSVSIARRVWVLLQQRRLTAALFGCTVHAAVVTSFDTVLPLFVETMFGWSSTAAGLLFFALFIPPCVLSPLIGHLADRWGAKRLALAGFGLTTPVLVCLRFVDRNTIGEKVLLGVLLSLLGVTLTMCSVPLMAEISFAIEAAEAAEPGIWGDKGVYGLGYGLFTTAFALGSAVGSLGAGYIQADYGWRTMTWAVAIWSAAGCVTVLLCVGETDIWAWWQKRAEARQAASQPVVLEDAREPSPAREQPRDDEKETAPGPSPDLQEKKES